jgi:hypothetical protein
MGFFNPENYETVEERLVRWWAAYPEAQINTSMIHYDAKTVVFKAEGIVDGRLIATGYAEEVLGSSPVNKTSFVENCETSAIGRMIANSPLGVEHGGRPSAQEMQKVQRQNANPPARISAPQAQQYDDSEPTPQELAEVLADQFNGTVQSAPRRQSTGSVEIKNPNEPASVKQLGMIRALLAQDGATTKEAQLNAVIGIIGREIGKFDEMNKGEASAVITALKS